MSADNSSDVAIVGAGIHPFGRHESTGMEQGAVATSTSNWVGLVRSSSVIMAS